MSKIDTFSDWSPRELECQNCLKSLANGGNCEDLNCADYPCPSQEPKPSTIEGFIDEEHHAVVITGTRAKTRGCSFCGNPLTLLMENREYRLWACQPLKGREGCGRLLLEDAREHLGSTWYFAEQNEPDGRRL